ncbi:MAG: hypothetical protein AAGE05_05755 [Pseudomonadota bacterium]
MRAFIATLLAGVVSISATQAQTPESPDPATLLDASQQVADQNHYPPGYRDMLIAATGMTMEMVASAEQDATTGRQTYEPFDWNGDGAPEINMALPFCGLGAPWEDPQMDRQTSELVYLAYEMGWLRFHLPRAGYPRQMYDELLLRYEREQLALLERAYVTGTYVEPEIEPTDEGAEEAFDPTIFDLLEVRRREIAPDLPSLFDDAACGGVWDPRTTFNLVPANGQIWLINAFLFAACSVGQSNPWDPRNCRWTEIEAATSQPLIGRYHYIVRWPSGAERTGTRELGMTPGEDATVTLRLPTN